MITIRKAATVLGLDVIPVSVEVDISTGGLPSLSVVGLPDKAIDESRERVRSALRASGYQVPARRVTINLGPADVRKTGPSFDLPIALAILSADAQIQDRLKTYWAVGELALDGSLRPIRGVLSIAIEASRLGIGKIIVPAANAAEAAVVNGLKVYGANTLKEAVAHIEGSRLLNEASALVTSKTWANPEIDFADIKGQATAKRALEIAAAGGHNVLMTGPPGTGKTLLAKALPGILPPLRESEMLEVTAIWSIAGLLPNKSGLITQRPFRAPHHSISLAALVGGGSLPRPGEISLAHRGVLYLDELPQFAPAIMESIRGPLEDRRVRVNRSHHSSEFPSDCMVIASQNPCPCGFSDDPDKPCQCAPAMIARYQRRISGPICDRFDLVIGVPRLPYKEIKKGIRESSKVIRKRVECARLCQRQRYNNDMMTNAGLLVRDMDKYCAITKTAARMLGNASDRWHFSVRSVHRVLKLARTISDLANIDIITDSAVAEALSYRKEAATV